MPSIESSDDVKQPGILIEAGAPALNDSTISQLSKYLPRFVKTQRWFRAKARTIQDIRVADAVPFGGPDSYVFILDVRFAEGDSDTYLLPLAAERRAGASSKEYDAADTVAMFTQEDGTEGAFLNALGNDGFRDALFSAIACNRHAEGRRGEVVGVPAKAFRSFFDCAEPALRSAISRAEQSNSSIIYADRFILKLFRKLEPGINPDLEVGMFLTERGFKHTPAVLGHLEYRPKHGDVMYAAILQAFVPNQGDAWKYTLGELSGFFDQVLGPDSSQHAPPLNSYHPFALMDQEVAREIGPLFRNYLSSAHLLGVRTAQMHAALTDTQADSEFAPERWNSRDAESLFEDMRRQCETTMNLLRLKHKELTRTAGERARELLRLEPEVYSRFVPLRDSEINTVRIRYHGDFHLGQVLYTGDDFLIIDFEGEPARPLAERRKKTLAMRDVAGMIRSFQYAAYAALFERVAATDGSDMGTAESWADFWTAWVSAAYLKAYFETAGDGLFVPVGMEERRLLFDAFLLQKALYEVAYELNNRPTWVGIPLGGILSLVS